MGIRRFRPLLLAPLCLALAACAGGPAPQAPIDEPLPDTGKTTGDAIGGALILPRAEFDDEPEPTPTPWLVLYIAGDGRLRREGATLLERDEFTPARVHALLKGLREEALNAGRATLEKRQIAEGEVGDVVHEPLLLQVDAAADWKYAKTVMTACSSPDVAIWKVQVQVVKVAPDAASRVGQRRPPAAGGGVRGGADDDLAHEVTAWRSSHRCWKLENRHGECKLSTMIARASYHSRVQQGLRRAPIVMLVGPRQCGKSTLARELARGEPAVFFDLEDPEAAAALSQPMTALRDLRGLVVLDEAQRRPELFPVLRVLADRDGSPARFLLLGSASPELSRQAAESLAGRVEVVEMRGFDLGELGAEQVLPLWSRGGFPRSMLAGDDADSFRWRQDFIATFLERDLGVLGFGMSPVAMRRFWTMLSHYHGQIWNASEIASSMGVSPHTTRKYLDALEQTFMVRTLQPWFENIGKRQVKSPKIYLRDSGIFHALQGIRDHSQLLVHPKLGASWEGFALEEVLRAFRPDQAWFHAVHSGSELDLLFVHESRRIGVEFKREDAPRVSRSMRVAQQDLRLDRLLVVYPGMRRYSMAEGIECVPLLQIDSAVG